MLKKIRLYNEEDGVGVTWFALSFVVILFIMGLVIDGGRLYRAKIELRKTANAAVLSGAQELKSNDSKVITVVNKILRADGEESSLKEPPNITHDSQDKVAVTLEKNVPLYFMKLFNFPSAPVSVKSSAALAPISRTVGAVPFGIDESVTLNYGQTYSLKVDAGDSTAGNFGILALAGVGASNYEDSLKYGYENEIEIGDIINTQTGNVEMKTRNAINYRYDNSPYALGDMTHRDDPRIVVILVYRVHEAGPQQIQSVEVTGFAYFYIKERLGANDSSVDGEFIQLVGTGIGDATAPDNGAYAIKLVE